MPSLLGLLINYQGGNMVCKKAAEEMGENFTQKPIGTGPFMFGEYKSKQSVTLVANPQYFRGSPKLEKIVYRYIPSDASRDLAFTSGEIDLIYGKQDQTWVERMNKEKDVIVDVFEPGELSVLYLNVEKARSTICACGRPSRMPSTAIRSGSSRAGTPRALPSRSFRSAISA